jgi:hypothetical protein
MVLPRARFQHDPRKLVDCLSERAKRWWGVTALIKVCSVSLGTLSVLIFPSFKSSAVIVFLLYIASELATWRSDVFKGSAQAVLRKLDFSDSFGWEISRAEMSDLIVDCPSRLRRKIPPETDDDYFTSSEPVGTNRSLDNLQESSWWSKHLSRRMGHLTLGVSITLILTSLIVLLVSINSVQNFDALTSIGRVVTSGLMLIVSLGFLRLTLGYYQFAKKAEQSERDAIRLLGYNFGELDAVKAWHEYQVSRAVAPLIPSRLWRHMNKDLNEAWKAYRKPFDNSSLPSRKSDPK